MREIKFRAWDKQGDQMLYKELFDRNWYATPTIDEGGCHTVRQADYTDSRHLEIMQYTGLKDKNGKKIYEGDILAPKEYLNEEGRQIVSWDDDFTGFVTSGGLQIRDECDEVIGNIYENPDLTK